MNETTTQMGTEDPSQSVPQDNGAKATASKRSIYVHSAGRSLRAASADINRDFICFADMSTNGGKPTGGLYAVADGSLSTKAGEIASQTAIETLKRCFNRFYQNEPAGEQGGENILEKCLPQINSDLDRMRSSSMSDDSFVSSLVCGYFDGNRFHSAHAGNGSVYLVHNARIQRITVNHDIKSLTDPALSEEYGAKSILGFNTANFRAGFASIDVTPGDTILICSDGVTERVDNLSLLDFALNSSTPEESVERILKKAALKTGANDMSIVAVNFEGPDDEPPVFAQKLTYPSRVIAGKVIIPAFLLILLAALFYIGATILAPQLQSGITTGSDKESAAPAATAVNTSGDQDDSVQIGLPKDASLKINSIPSGATVLVNGKPIPGKTPLDVKVKGGESVEIRAALSGYLEHLETVQAPEDGGPFTLDVKMQKLVEPPGDISVTCQDRCDSLRIDGVRVEGVLYPRTMLTKSLETGEHTIEASRGKEIKSRKITIVSHKLSRVRFVFEAATESPAQPVTAVQPAAKTPPSPLRQQVDTSSQTKKSYTSSRNKNNDSIEVKHAGSNDYNDRNANGGVQLKRNTKVSSGQSPVAEPAAQATVKIQATSASGQISGGRVSFFQAGRLVATGYSGENIKLAPGSYDIQVSKEGFQVFSDSRYIGAGQSSISVFLTP